MANNEVSIIASNGKGTVSSKEVALHFQKKHKHILEEIERIRSMTPKEFHEPNFRPMFIDVIIGNGAVRKDKAYLLTRDAFSLLAMGFTGKAAISWKLKYIEAFNALEAAALGQARAIGASKALSLSPLQNERIKKVTAYRQRGFSQREIAKVMALHQRTVCGLLKTARELGMGV